MSTHQSPGRPQDDRYTIAYTDLVDDLTTVLDLTTGAHDATHPAAYDTLTADLSAELHLDTGLTAIIGSHPTSVPPAGNPPAPPGPAHPQGQLSDQLKSLTDPERLALRSHPSCRRLLRDLGFIPDLVRVRTLAHDLLHTLDLGLAVDLDLALALARALDLDLGLAVDLARALDRDLDLGLTVDLALARAHARALARDLDLDRALDLDLLTLARGRGCALAGTLDLALTLAFDYAHDLADGLVHIVVLDLRFDLATSEELTRILGVLAEAADDFVGADLRAVVDLDMTGLEGIRWSPATAWPPGWEDRVRAISVEIEPGIFQVVGGGRRSLQEATPGT